MTFEVLMDGKLSIESKSEGIPLGRLFDFNASDVFSATLKLALRRSLFLLIPSTGGLLVTPEEAFVDTGVGCNIGLCCLILVLLLSFPGGFGKSGINGFFPCCIWDETFEMDVIKTLLFELVHTSVAAAILGSELGSGMALDVSSLVEFNLITVT